MSLDEVIRHHCLVVKQSANGLGEILREWAFPEEGYGCYSTFEVRRDFEEVEPGPREFRFLWQREFDADDTTENSWGYCDVQALKEIQWFRHPNGIEVGWHWDGDGSLAFFVPELVDEHCDGSICNGDCKKDNEWSFGSTPTQGEK